MYTSEKSACFDYDLWYNADIDLAYQYLVPAKRASTISNMVAVILTLALPRIYIILKRSVPKILLLCKLLGELNVLLWCKKNLRCFARKAATVFYPKSAGTSIEGIDLTLSRVSHPRQESQHRILTGILDTLQRATTTESAIQHLARHHLAMPNIALRADAFRPHILSRIGTNNIDEPKASTYTLFSMLSLFAEHVNLLTISISSNFILGSYAAIIKQAACGCYTTKDSYGGFGPDVILGFSAHHSHQSSLTESALSNAASWYKEAGSSTFWDTALRRNILYQILVNNSCPFPESGMCKYGNNSVYSLDTGFIDARVLGINSAKNFEFRRRTTCSPVLDNDHFVQLETVSDNILEIRYSYGMDFYKESSSDVFRERRHKDYNKLLDSGSGLDSDIQDRFLNKAYDVQ